MNKIERKKVMARVVTVAREGNGDYRTIQEAIDSVPLGNTCRTVIRVSPGIYKQPLYVPKTKNLITLAGLRPEITVITWDNTATKIDHHQGQENEENDGSDDDDDGDDGRENEENEEYEESDDDNDGQENEENAGSDDDDVGSDDDGQENEENVGSDDDGQEHQDFI